MKSSILDRLRDTLQLCSLCAVIVIAYNGGALRNTEAIKVLLIVMVGIGNILFGKLFCSNMCPMGLVQEWIAERRKKEYLRIARWSGPDKFLRAIKYILLILFFIDYHLFLFNAVIGLIILSVLLVGNMSFCKYICPINAASNIFRFTILLMSVLLVNWGISMAGITLPLWITVAVLSCSGYIFEIHFRKAEFNISMLHIHRDPSKCRNCGACRQECPYGVDIPLAKRVTDIDCNLCGECVRECPNDALKAGICQTRPDQNRIRGIWFAPLATIILLGIAIYILLK